ncbi:DUF167 domain-containing protein [Actinokineospora inagensis]|uniref:DUF167 domain-containing protein n=1 Tax=Actinokineospora inagensis TaxID=103730 RepID=UPI00041CC03E|nr:DUF167 domain-containing protein [Actinokineospora inagensis]
MGLRFGVRVRPGARRTAVGGRWDGGGPVGGAAGGVSGTGGGVLVVAVTAPAVAGKANEAVRLAVAAAFGVRGRDVVIVSGERGRDKVVEIDPPPADGGAVLERLLGE